jgi:hypothetical protein
MIYENFRLISCIKLALLWISILQIVKISSVKFKIYMFRAYETFISVYHFLSCRVPSDVGLLRIEIYKGFM